VAILTDFRYPGGTSASVAEEIRAQNAAGLSTVLVQVPSPHLRSVRRFNQRIVDLLKDGHADLAGQGDTISARVLLLRQPRIFTADLATLPRIAAAEVVMVLNQSPNDLGNGRTYYDLKEVQRRVHGYFGDEIRWVTIGPQVRQSVQAASPELPLSPVDWHNIIDVSQWWFDRKTPVADVPVIGRHSRPDPAKWPVRKDDLLQAYPPSDDFRVRILGGGEHAAALIGGVPPSWEILPFGAMRASDFLRTIDYFVYYHHPNLVEAFGRTVLEAMASGVPVIVPHTFRGLFEDAAIYAAPNEVQDVVHELHADWDRYRNVSSRAVSFVRERFGYESHIARLAGLGVPVDGSHPHESRGSAVPTAVSTAGEADSVPSAPAGSVMMLSSNGAGLGHVTRLMAIARRLHADLRAVIATQSYAASVVQDEGYLTEYIPSRGYLDISAKRWNEFLHDRLLHLIEVHKPSAVAVDATVPYEGLLATIAAHPDITWVWVRRAMWKKGSGLRWIERGWAFDVVLEPGEFGAAMDEGPTVAERSKVIRVDPITYLDADEALDRESARKDLRLSDQPTALLQLGAGNINDISTAAARIAACLRDHGFQVVVAESPIATRPPGAHGMQVIKQYPLSRHLKAFDLAVSAAGYNSFHELIAFGVPTVFVPNQKTALDDQVARARFAAGAGVGLAVYEFGGSGVEDVLKNAVRPDVRAALAERCSELSFSNGASEAARYLNEICGIGRVGASVGR
jgi:UDP:flavonoid glycosyltransferase YjiC (YdhE family)/glycosyltransferase involved in cell wall biosynthesis